MATDTPLVLAVTGPTASGKTEVALALAERHPISLISMDSAMVYRGMDIGTAKPAPAVRSRHPHAVVDIRDPADPYSAADFLADADLAVKAALAAGRLPVLVGGTMLYLKAFREGLAELPAADPAVRETIAAEARQRGWAALHETLAQLDPVAARGIHPNNHVRIQRALEVYRLTGTPISRWWTRQGARGADVRLGVRLREVAILPERADLGARIETRFLAMLEAGLVAEVSGLRARGDLSLALPSMRSVGYRQVWEHLDGQSGSEALARRGVTATRALARRQLTWLRGWPHVTAFPSPATAAPDQMAERIARHVQLEIS